MYHSISGYSPFLLLLIHVLTFYVITQHTISDVFTNVAGDTIFTCLKEINLNTKNIVR